MLNSLFALLKELVQEREKAREGKDFAESDELRKRIKEEGYEVVDTSAGPALKKILAS